MAKGSISTATNQPLQPITDAFGGSPFAALQGGGGTAVASPSSSGGTTLQPTGAITQQIGSARGLIEQSAINPQEQAAEAFTRSGALATDPLARNLLSQGSQTQDPFAATAIRGGINQFDPRAAGSIVGGINRFDPQGAGFAAQGAQLQDPRARGLIRSSGGTTGAFGLAQQEAADAFSPTRGTRDFNVGSERLLSQLRPGLAARGIVGGGVAQGIENEQLRKLSEDIAFREQAGRQTAIGQLEGVGGAQLGRQFQAGQGLGALAAERGGRLLAGGQTLAGIAGEQGGRAIAGGQALGGLAAEQGQRAIAGGAQLGGLAGQLAQQRLAGGQGVGNLLQQQAGRQLQGGAQLGQIGAQGSAQRLAAGQGLLGASSVENTLATGALGREISKSQAELASILGAQSATARGFQLPLDILNQAVQTETGPLAALTALVGASQGGSSVTNSRTSGSGGGLFGK